MPTRLPQAALPHRLIGYARVSTEEQDTDPQLDELRAAGCAAVLEEHASGADRSRPVLARLLHEIQARRDPGRRPARPLGRCGISVSAWRRIGATCFRRYGLSERKLDFGVMRNYVCPLHHSCGPRQVRPHGRTLAREAVLG